MSVRVLARVWDHFPGGGSELLALLALADWSDDDGRCWPSMTAIGQKCRLSRSQALRVIHKIINDGFLVVEGNEHGGAPGATRRYRIDLERLTGSANATGSAHATGSVDATRRVAPMHKTGSAHATQTVSEPSVNHQEVADRSSVGSKTAAQYPPHPEERKGTEEVADTCPISEIVAVYHQKLPNNPKVKVLTKQRKGLIRARWREAARLSCRPFGYKDRGAGLKAWEEFFEICSESPFLTGRATPQPGKPPFFASIDFLMSPSGFAKTLENHYHREVPA